LKSYGSKNRDSPQSSGDNAFREEIGILPSDVALRVFGADPSGTSDSQNAKSPTEVQRQAIVSADILSSISFPRSLDAKGTEHVVRFRGSRVEKHQHSDGWMPEINSQGMITIRKATPLEYLSRLQFQNDLFGDHITVIGLTRANRFAISQPTLRGAEPKENEIRDVLEQASWKRLPINCQTLLPHQLMGSAWYHDEEQLILLDARKPNFKKTDYGTLPIDLIIGELTSEMAASIHHHQNR
jgi:hypothetical protein